MHQIFVLSDGTGRTAERALDAALTQFSEARVDIVTYPGVRTKEQVNTIIQDAIKSKAFIVHTVVTKGLREYLLDQGRLNNVDTIDQMGPLLAQLSHHFADSPAEKPGLFHELNRAYFQRIEAMEFAFRHDDGQHVDELQSAEIVLVGVSRTFKTPLTMYFAFKGWYAANVPIILDLEPPPILFELPPERVFGLTTDSNHLALLRKVRHKHLGGATGKYVELPYVSQELQYALKIFNRSPKWPIINVTNKPIEEIASEILSILRDKDAIEKNER